MTTLETLREAIRTYQYRYFMNTETSNPDKHITIYDLREIVELAIEEENKK